MMRVVRASMLDPQMRGFPKFLSKMALGLQDTNVFIETDSTGNETTEWVYLFSQWLASRYPTHTVVYRLFDNATKTYSTVNLQTGTGSRTLTIWNGAIPGAHCYFPQLVGFNTIFAAEPDIVLLSYGHNEGTHLVKADGLTFAARYKALIRRIMLRFQGAELGLGIQNPQISNTYQQLRSSFIRQIAQQYGLAIFDMQSMFLAYANWSTQWMLDNVHTNATGSKLGMLPPVQALFDDRLFPVTTGFAGTTVIGGNLLTNGDFSSFTPPSAPTGWTVLNGATVSKDTSNFETAGWGVKIVSAAGASGWMQQNVSSNFNIASFQGRQVTLTAWLRRPNGNAATSGRIQIYDGVVSAASTQNATVQTDTGIYVESVTMEVSSNATMLRAYLYADSGTTGNQEVTFDRVSLVRGDMPIDMYL
jgi:hypothetical protein